MSGNLWTDKHAATIDLENFRGHDQYLEQRPEYPYAAMCEFIWERGWAPEMAAMGGEDGAFGCVTADVSGVTVSRDLIDSVMELSVLSSVLRGPKPLVLDIGAGYGRFAHRFSRYAQAVYCTDPIPVSRVVCAKYLAHRGLPPEWVIAPEELHVLPPIDLAVNIHSWSECHLDEVCAWLDWLADHNVPRLFIVPHEPGFHTWHGPSYLPELAKRRYELAHQWSGPACNPRHYYLFERVGT